MTVPSSRSALVVHNVSVIALTTGFVDLSSRQLLNRFQSSARCKELRVTQSIEGYAYDIGEFDLKMAVCVQFVIEAREFTQS